MTPKEKENLIFFAAKGKSAHESELLGNLSALYKESSALGKVIYRSETELVIGEKPTNGIPFKDYVLELSKKIKPLTILSPIEKIQTELVNLSIEAQDPFLEYPIDSLIFDNEAYRFDPLKLIQNQNSFTTGKVALLDLANQLKLNLLKSAIQQAHKENWSLNHFLEKLRPFGGNEVYFDSSLPSHSLFSNDPKTIEMWGDLLANWSKVSPPNYIKNFEELSHWVVMPELILGTFKNNIEMTTMPRKYAIDQMDHLLMAAKETYSSGSHPYSQILNQAIELFMEKASTSDIETFMEQISGPECGLSEKRGFLLNLLKGQ